MAQQQFDDSAFEDVTPKKEPGWFQPGSKSFSAGMGYASGLAKYPAALINSYRGNGTYEQNIAEIERIQAKAKEQNPVSYAGGDVAGSILPTLAGAGVVSKALPAMSGFKKGLILNTGIGAESGAVQPADSTGQRLAQTGIGAGTGAVLGAAGGGLGWLGGKAVQIGKDIWPSADPILNKINPKIIEMTSNAKNEALNKVEKKYPNIRDIKNPADYTTHQAKLIDQHFNESLQQQAKGHGIQVGTNPTIGEIQGAFINKEQINPEMTMTPGRALGEHVLGGLAGGAVDVIAGTPGMGVIMGAMGGRGLAHTAVSTLGLPQMLAKQDAVKALEAQQKFASLNPYAVTESPASPYGMEGLVRAKNEPSYFGGNPSQMDISKPQIAVGTALPQVGDSLRTLSNGLNTPAVQAQPTNQFDDSAFE